MSENLALPLAGSKKIEASGWVAGERPGELVRPLIDDPAGYRTMLMQVAPGPLGELHATQPLASIFFEPANGRARFSLIPARPAMRPWPGRHRNP